MGKKLAELRKQINEFHFHKILMQAVRYFFFAVDKSHEQYTRMSHLCSLEGILSYLIIGWYAELLMVLVLPDQITDGPDYR